MKLNIQDNSHANVSFTNLVKVSIRGEHGYLVKWYRDENFIGQMELNGGTWGGFENEIGNWRLEFWQGENLVNSTTYNIENENILFIYNFNTEKGKLPNINSMITYISELRDKYNFIPYVYFKGSEKYDLPFNTLKLNDFADFIIIVEKNG
jgi:hypothetical protein